MLLSIYEGLSPAPPPVGGKPRRGAPPETPKAGRRLGLVGLGGLLGLGLVGLVGCSDGPGPCTGDCTQPIVLAAAGIRDGVVADLAEGDVVSIEPPGQGGWVIYVGVRAQNVHGLTATLNAALRAPGSPQVVALEHRSVRLIDDGAGWARPDSAYQDLANVAVCSFVPGPEAFDRSTWRLELRLTDVDGRVAETAVAIRPECGAGDSFGCQCSCGVNGVCPVDPADAGVDAPGDSGAPDAP